jgi:hypothetical protein
MNGGAMATGTRDTKPLPIKILIKLSIEKGEVVEEVRYLPESDVNTAAFREKYMKLDQKIAEKKKERGEHNLPPEKPHSPKSQKWIVRANDTVTWESEEQFMLSVDHDIRPCKAKPDAPRNPFRKESGELWSGVQKSEWDDADSVYRVTGIVAEAVYEAAVDQMFYKYTAFVEGYEPLDPDGACGYPDSGPP